mgnify:CR=1 FL=1
MTEPTLPMPTAAEFMSDAVITVSPDSDITDVVGVLIQGGYSGVPVLAASGAVLGVLTDEICMRALSGAAFNGEVTGKVADHMSREFVVVEPEADLFRVISSFQGASGRLFVAKDGRLLGVVTRTDALKALERLRQLREQHGDHLETISQGWSALSQP